MGELGLLFKEKRIHIVNETHPGASTTVYIGKHGTDLFVAWHTYIRPLINWKLIIAMILLAGLFGIITGLGPLSAYIITAGVVRLITEQLATELQTELPAAQIEASTALASFGTCFLFNSALFFSLEATLVVLAGLIAKKNPLGYFFIEPNIFDTDDITAMNLSAHKALLQGLDQVGIDTDLLRLKPGFKGARESQEL
jgi:hypothetical protein